MIERYTHPHMGQRWTRDAKYEWWLKVEMAVMAAQEELGIVPPGTHGACVARATYSIEEMDRIEEEVKHDVIAFLTNVGDSLGEHRRFLHLGMTSSDLIDTALACQIVDSGNLVYEVLLTLRNTLYELACKHKNTAMIGRSHGIHGEPITFGLKVLVWVDELDRHLDRLAAAIEEIAVGQISGAMGTYAHMPPQVEEKVCKHLGLKAAPISTQVIGRDRHACFMVALAQIASSFEKIATEIRHLQRTDVLEVEEPFTKGQKGSSAMPHKRNPVSSENITGLARMVRAYAVPALENVALWHERDISHSSVERIALPDALILIHYMARRMNGVMADLVVYPDNMARNMQCYGGVIFSQRVLLTLVDKGLNREDAYKLAQRNAHAAWNTLDGDFKANLLADTEVTEHLSSKEIEACFDPTHFLSEVDTIFGRFALRTTTLKAPSNPSNPEVTAV